MAESALAGIRILDLADEKGALCAKLLGDMGADVIKVERPGGDPMRRIGPFWQGVPHRDRSLFFWFYNTSKRGITLDIGKAAGQQIFARLLEKTDIIIETFPPGTLDKLGLGFETLRRCNPRLILVSITPFGQTGPYRDYKASDTVAEALGGMAYVNGFPNEPPLRALGLQAYHSASFSAAIGALCALWTRETSGHGQWIDVSIQEATVAAVEHVSGFYFQRGTIEERRGSLHWTRYFRVAKCRDGYVMHCTLGDWTSLIEWVKADGMAQDLSRPDWEHFPYRRRHAGHLFDILDEWAKNYRVADLMEGAQLRRIPYAMVRPPEALPEDPQLRDRGFFVPVHHPEWGAEFRYPGAPYLFHESPWQITRRPPLVGEHNEEIYGGELGLSQEELVTLAAEESNPWGFASQPAHMHPQRHVAEGRRALEGIRILDFTWVVAGPVATRILADQGAEVIKIERRDSMDFGTRRGGFTGNLFRSKYSMVINMADARGIDLTRKLVEKSDVVIDNFSARVMKNWGLDYENLRRIKADIIAVSMSGFGHTGPYKDYVSYGPTLQALSGFTYLMRHPGGEPAGWGYSHADMAGGYAGALAVLMALWYRRRTGKGQFIDLAQFETICALIGPGLLDILVNGNPLHPTGNRSQEAPAAPHGIYRCSGEDRWCAITVFTEEEWQAFSQAIGHPPWTRDSRFSSRLTRIQNHAALDRCVEQWTKERTAEEVMDILQKAGVAAGVVANAADLCDRDPQLQARGYWARVKTPEGEEVLLDGVPFKLSETPGYVCSPGPLLGEHTDHLLAKILGLSPSDIGRLKAEGVVASAGDLAATRAPRSLG